MKALGGKIGHSMVDDEKVDYCREMKEKAGKLGKALLIPIDNVVAKEFPNPIDAPIEIETVHSNEIPDGYMGLDIGEETRELYKKALRAAKTIVWNGPMGVFENPQLAAGTLEIAKVVAEVGPANGAVTIIGGGDSVAAVTQLGFADKMSHISTGGGASLEYLEGKVLPGIKVIQDK
jgi:phosphoglycerate kinase